MTTTHAPPAAGMPAPAPRDGNGPGVPDAPFVVGRRPQRRFPWKQVGWVALVAAAVGLLVFVLAFTRPTGSDVPYSPANASENGGRAVAEVLGEHGVDVTEVSRVSEAYETAAAGETLVITPNATYFERGQIDALQRIESDVVLLGPDQELLDAFTDGHVQTWAAGPADREGAQCAAPAARAAENVRLDAGLNVEGGRVDACWPSADGFAFAYARTQVDGRWVHVIHDPDVVRNDTVLAGGNAALALWTLGAHEKLTWFVPDPFDTSMPEGPSDGSGGSDGGSDDDGSRPPAADAGSLLPEGTTPVVWVLLLTAVVLAVWRGRRLGPLVTEPMPVLVRSAETMRGRARLYRAVRSRGHAAAGLRASAAHRMAQRLGLARSADATTVTDAVAAATHRPAEQVAHLLYGPPPADDGELTELVRSLDNLESEVHRS
ncbi:DUF4350 domain-containing protein [Myceligenerans cantabricum]